MQQEDFAREIYAFKVLEEHLHFLLEYLVEELDDVLDFAHLAAEEGEEVFWVHQVDEALEGVKLGQGMQQNRRQIGHALNIAHIRALEEERLQYVNEGLSED